MPGIRRCLSAALLSAFVGLSSPSQAAEGRATLRIDCRIAGALVTLDGKPVGTTPLKPLPVTVGPHVVKVVKSGKISFEKRVVVPAAGQTVVATAARAGDDLELDLGPVTAKKAERKAPDVDLDLALDLPVAGSSKEKAIKPRPKGKATPVAKSAESLAVDEELLDLALLPATKPAPAPALPKTQALVEPKLTPPAPAFVVDPIALEQVASPVDAPATSRRRATPLYKNPWLWSGVAAAVAAGVIVPVALGLTGGYEERRDPSSACPDCVVVLNR